MESHWNQIDMFQTWSLLWAIDMFQTWSLIRAKCPNPGAARNRKMYFLSANVLLIMKENVAANEHTDTTPCWCLCGCQTSVSHVWWMVIDIHARGVHRAREIMNSCWFPLIAAPPSGYNSTHLFLTLQSHLDECNTSNYKHICITSEYAPLEQSATINIILNIKQM